MKASDIRDLSMAELDTKSRELRHELFNVKVKKTTGQLEDTAKLARLRRDIARVETIMSEKRGVEQ